MASELRQTRFGNQRLDRVGVEVMTLEQFQARAEPRWLATPERIGFHLLLLMTAGRGVHVVDFESIALRPGSLVAVRPGQVQRWQLRKSMHGVMVLVSPDALGFPLATPTGGEQDLWSVPEHWPARIDLTPAVQAEIADNIDTLRHEIERFDGLAVSTALIRQTTGCLWLRVAREVRAAQPALPPPSLQLYRMFAQELDAQLTRRPTVQTLSARLGYSVSSLHRACRDARGRSAKQLIDERIALEASRLLVHSAAPAAAIGAQLGFSEATNFVKFFRRVVGQPPDAFRRSHRVAP